MTYCQEGPCYMSIVGSMAWRHGTPVTMVNPVISFQTTNGLPIVMLFVTFDIFINGYREKHYSNCTGDIDLFSGLPQWAYINGFKAEWCKITWFRLHWRPNLICTKKLYEQSKYTTQIHCQECGSKCDELHSFRTSIKSISFFMKFLFYEFVLWIN